MVLDHQPLFKSRIPTNRTLLFTKDDCFMVVRGIALE